MGYSATKNAIDKVANHLKEMMMADEEIVWLTDDPNNLRYLLFQAFASGEAFAAEGEPFATIATLRSKFKIRCGKNRVIAEPRRTSPLASLRAQAQSKVVVKDVVDRAGIIAAIGLHKAAEIVFLDVSPEDLGLPGLHEIAKKYGYYMIPGSTTLTFSKNPDDEELAWTPEEDK